MDKGENNGTPLCVETCVNAKPAIFMRENLISFSFSFFFFLDIEPLLETHEHPKLGACISRCSFEILQIRVGFPPPSDTHTRSMR